MTKPAVPQPAHNEVVEIDAMDVAEWESGQSTPQASDANLAELVRKTASSPQPLARVQTVARERSGTQIGAPVIPRPPSRARTAPLVPAPKPARPEASRGGPPAPPARTTRAPDMPARPEAESRRSQPPASSGVDFSLPVTATGERGPQRSEAEPRRSQPPAPSSGIDFSLPVTAAGESGAQRSEPEPRRSQPPASSGTGWSWTATAASESGARPPEPEPPDLETPPPSLATSPFAEASRVGPGHNASPADSAEPNTAWPPRPIPVDARLPPAPRVAPDASMSPGHNDDGAERFVVALTGRRLWWIGGCLVGVSLAVVIAAALLPNPEALPPGAGEGGRRPLVAPPPEPIDRGAPPAHQDPARPAHAPTAPAAGAAAAPATAGAVDRQLTRPAPAGPDTSMRIPSAAPRAGQARKKPATHKLIVDYTARPDETPPPSLIAQSAEDPAIGDARGAYTAGNQRLFVGDLDGAVRAYRRTLELYPGYVGGYRGLGLAYEELGDMASALAALRAYVAAVPHARDVALIKKRIAHLQRR